MKTNRKERNKIKRLQKSENPQIHKCFYLQVIGTCEGHQTITKISPVCILVCPSMCVLGFSYEMKNASINVA